MKALLLAAGRMRGVDAELCAEYEKRLGAGFAVKEITAGTPKAEASSFLKSIAEKSFVILCDERGKDLSSAELADTFAAWQGRGVPLIFLIGGADGVTDEIRARADFTLSFGRKTWPHRLARIMLLEQLYRARQINAGHPYHRE